MKIITIFLLIFSIGSIKSQNLELDITDKSFGNKIEIDSVRLINDNLKIDTLFKVFDNININDLLVYNSIDKSKKNNIVSLSQNILKVKSELIYDKIVVFDILGQKIIEFKPNSNNFNIDINKDLNIVLIEMQRNNQIELNIAYNNRNSTTDYSKITNDLTTLDWQIVFYKKGFKDTTLFYTEIPNKIKLEYERINLKFYSEIEFKFNANGTEQQLNGSFKSYNRDGIKNIKTIIQLFKNKNISKTKCGVISSYLLSKNPFYYLDYGEVSNNSSFENSNYNRGLKSKTTENYILIDENMIFAGLMASSCNKHNYGSSSNNLMYELKNKIDLKPLINGEIDIIEIELNLSEIEKYSYNKEDDSYGEYHDEYKIGNNLNFVKLKIEVFE